MKHIVMLPVLLLAACAPAASEPPITVEVTRQVEVTRLVEVTREVVVTVIPTPAMPTPTSGPTSTPAPTTDLTRADKRDGSYMAVSEIAPGIWRSKGTGSEGCALTVKDFSGDLVDITYDPPGSTIRIPAGDYIVVIGGGSGNLCTWSFLQA